MSSVVCGFWLWVAQWSFDLSVWALEKAKELC